MLQQNGMDVMNTDNVLFFNNMICESRRTLAKELPHDVVISLDSEFEGMDSPVVTLDISEADRLDYIRTYVDELDLFGSDLMGHPVSSVFAPCVTEREQEILAENTSLTPEVQQIYASIWERAYALEMEQNREDILMDAESHFREDMYGRAWDAYYVQRGTDGYTRADRDYIRQAEAEQERE